MPAVRASAPSRKGLLLRYDSLIEVVDVDADRPEEEFGQGGLVAESSVCGHARLLWTRTAMQEPENEQATRLVHQRVQGDALLVFNHAIPLLHNIDSSTQFSVRTLLHVFVTHAPGGPSKHVSHPVRPCVRTLIATILSSQAFPPRLDHKKPLEPYPPHGAEHPSEPGALQPIRQSFDRPPTPTHASLAAHRNSTSDIPASPTALPAAQQPHPPPLNPAQTHTPVPTPARAQPSHSTTPTSRPTAAPGPSTRLATPPARPSTLPATTPAAPSSVSDTTSQLTQTPSRRKLIRGRPLHHHDGSKGGCSCSNPPPQIHAIHRHLAKKRLSQQQSDATSTTTSAGAAAATSATSATVPSTAPPAIVPRPQAASPSPAAAAMFTPWPGMTETPSDTAPLAAAADTDVRRETAVAVNSLDTRSAQQADATADAACLAAVDAQHSKGTAEIWPRAPPPPPAAKVPPSMPAAAAAAGPVPGGVAAAGGTDGAAALVPPAAAAVAAPAAPAAAGARRAVGEVGGWQGLHPDVLHMVYQRLNCQDLVTASCVCSSWRSAALQDREVLEAVEVKLSQLPLRHPVALGAALGMHVLRRLDWLLLPRVVQTAANTTGNAGAAFLCASVCEARSDLVGAAGYWKKAAKGGHAVAMYKLGSHFYHGDINSLGRSGEDALLWLQRFLKAAEPSGALSADEPEDSVPKTLAANGGAPPRDLADDGNAAADGGDDAAGSGGGGMLGVVGRKARLRQRRSNSAVQEQVARASLLLGYLHMDGEGTKASNLEAVRHMRRAALLGDEEAHRTLGWMYNTGQFGEGS
eukprot:jgi/Ulvmu1/943/UM102_0026.1